MVSLSFVHNGEGGGSAVALGGVCHGRKDMESEMGVNLHGSIFLSCSTFFSRFLSLMVLEGLLLGGGSSRLG